MSKKIKILIIGSLLLNVLLIGVIIGHISHRLSREPFFRRHAREFAVKLPADKRELFSKTMEGVHLENREIHRQIREARKRALRILTAPEFDEAAYQTEVDKLNRLRGHMMQRLADVTKELAKQLDQEERKGLAEHLRHPPSRHRVDRPPRHGIRPSHREGP